MSDVIEEPRIEDVVSKYIALRDKKAELDAAHKEKVASIDDALNRVEVYLLSRMQSMGVESVRTAAGTAYTSLKVSVSTADKDALIGFAKDNDLWSSLDIKPNKTFVQQYRKEHDDLPPGVNLREERVVNIRRG